MRGDTCGGSHAGRHMRGDTRGGTHAGRHMRGSPNLNQFVIENYINVYLQ